MSRGRKSPDPQDRMGVYKELTDVPPSERLETYTAQYADRDTWAAFLNEYLFERYDSSRFKEDARRAGRYWKAHMDERGRHHALATPTDVETWMASLLDRVNVTTAYNSYWVRLERFYWWLQYHTDHPHVYHPPLMAAAGDGAAGIVWAEKITRRETDD